MAEHKKLISNFWTLYDAVNYFDDIPLEDVNIEGDSFVWWEKSDEEIPIKEFWAFLNSSWSYNGKTATQYCDTIGKVIWLTKNKWGKITVLAGGNNKTDIIANVSTVEEAIPYLAAWLREWPRTKNSEWCICRYKERAKEERHIKTCCRFVKDGQLVKWVHGIYASKLPSKPLKVDWL